MQFVDGKLGAGHRRHAGPGDCGAVRAVERELRGLRGRLAAGEQAAQDLDGRLPPGPVHPGHAPRVGGGSRHDALGRDRLGMELDPPDGKGAVPQAHDLALLGLGGDLQVLREGGALHEERMVAGAREPLGKAPEQIGVSVPDRRGLAVHQPACADHVAPEVLPDRLVAEAYPEDGPAPGEGLDDVERHAGIARGARARRKKDAVGIERQRLLDGDLVVAEDPLLHAQLAEILDQVVGEGIEVIDDEEHGPPIDPRLTRGSRVRVGSCHAIWQVTFNCLGKTRPRTPAAAGWPRGTAPSRPRSSCPSARRAPSRR